VFCLRSVGGFLYKLRELTQPLGITFYLEIAFETYFPRDTIRTDQCFQISESAYKLLLKCKVERVYIMIDALYDVVAQFVFS